VQSLKQAQININVLLFSQNTKQARVRSCDHLKTENSASNKPAELKHVMKSIIITTMTTAFSALTLLVWRQEGHLACKKTKWWGAGMVICPEQDADLHMMAQLMPLPLTVSCFSKIQIGFTFLEPAHLGSPRQKAVKQPVKNVCITNTTIIQPLYRTTVLADTPVRTRGFC